MTPGPSTRQVRTADEIVTRFRTAGDPFGWERETISRYLDWSEANGTVSEVEEGWADWSRPRTVEAITADALAYLDYAWGCALGHRHLEAQRAMFKLDCWCWLLGDARLAHNFDDDADRGLYCVKAIASAAEFLGAPFPPDATRDATDAPRVPVTEIEVARLARMADGKPCVLGCNDGCIWPIPERPRS